MNVSKRVSIVSSVTLVVLLVGGCGTLPLAPAGNATATTAPTFTHVVETPTVLSTFTPLSLPTLPEVSPPTVQPTKTPLPVSLSISTSPEKFPLDNLPMTYIVDGNLYVQDGSNSPKRLSNSREDIYPVFFVSDDGKKIVFYHDKMKDDDVFSINSDGSHEQELITKDWLTTLGTGTKTGQLVFVPNTHQMLFNTYLCPKDLSSGCTVGLFLANTDTGEIKEIMPPDFGGDLLGYGNFSVSADGKFMSVAHAGQIDILNIDGKAVHPSVMKYTRSIPLELYPRVFWLSDSSGLIMALPDETDNRGAWYSGFPAYTVWRYTFDDNVATQIPLDPPPTWVSMECNDVMSVSPNGDWGVYFTEEYQVYRGNLVNGSTQLYLPHTDCSPAHWSSDSVHFIYGGLTGKPVLGSVDAPSGSIPVFFFGWIDSKRFIHIPYSSYPIKENIQILVGEIGGKTLLTYESNVYVPDIYPYSFTFTILDGR